MKKFLKVGIDVDDILLSCNQYAIDLTNEACPMNPPITLDELDSWGETGKRPDERLKWFSTPCFFETQPLLPGAKEFVHEVCKRAEVFFVTAVEPKFMSIRAERLLKEFPEVPKENIILGGRKDVISLDVLLDDGAHNIALSGSAYPVLMRMPWNQHMSGGLSVNNYKEFLTFLDMVIGQSAEPDRAKNRAIALVGPSASGKTALIKMAVEEGLAARMVSYTTRKPREQEEDGVDYHFITKEEFLDKERSGELFESTRYAGECYGSSISALRGMLKENNVVMAVDICGAIALKRALPDQACIVFVERPVGPVIQAILERECSTKEKTHRILSLSGEYRNKALCDVAIQNTEGIEHTYGQLKSILY